MALAIVHHPAFDAELPAGHRFPMAKFRRLAALLVEEGLATMQSFRRPEPADLAMIARVHEEAYAQAVFAGAVAAAIEREIGLPMSAAVAMRARAATAGTLLTARLALEYGIACNTAGGSHHAGREHGAGFCVFNDVAVAVRALQAEQLSERVLVVDCDVHQGDGTAAIFAGDPSVFTLSLHAANNYPVRKVPSDLDIALPDRAEDAAYLEAVRWAVAEAIGRFGPDIVFYNAGVDPHRDDRLGRLALSDQGLADRDAFVIEAVRSRGLPLAGVIGGGYSADVDSLACRHAILHHTAAQFV